MHYSQTLPTPISHITMNESTSTHIQSLYYTWMLYLRNRFERNDVSTQTSPISNFNRHGANTFVPAIIEGRERSISGPSSWEKMENLADQRPRVLTRGGKSWTTTSTYLDIRLTYPMQRTSSRFILDATEIKDRGGWNTVIKTKAQISLTQFVD